VTTAVEVLKNVVPLTRHNLAGYKARERHGLWACGCHFVDLGFNRTAALDICDEVRNRHRTGAFLLVPDLNPGPPKVAPDPRALEFA
jgi:hypothetical protein